jgi:hypothetical protein
MIGPTLPFIAFFVLCLGMICAASTGRVLSSGGWAHRQKDPLLFWLVLVNAMAGLAASGLALTTSE